MSQEPDVKQLLRDAITAARENDKERARVLFEEVVAQDPQNEKAWFWLASVAETDEERRVYLGNVVQINPNNERAQALLDKLESRQEHRPKSSLDEELIPGISRRLAIIGGAVVAILVVVICGAILLVLSSNQQAAANQQGTAAALQGTQDAIQVAAEMTQAEATHAAELGLITATPVGPTLPPTWTPVPTEITVQEVTPTPLATALSNPLFTGQLLAASGQDNLGQGYVPIVEIPLDGSPARTLFDGRARAPAISPQGDRIIYTRYSSGTGEQGLELISVDGTTQPRLLTTLLGGRVLSEQDSGSFSSDGNSIAFSAREPGNVRRDVFVLSLQALGDLSGLEVPEEIANQALNKLTDGTLSAYSPTWANSTRLVYVADATDSGGGVDLRVIAINGTQTAVTGDGPTLIENHPDVSPDGTRVAFDAYTPGSPDDTDIYIVAMDGGVSLLTVDTPFSDVRPRWSPDGRYLVYSSNRTGNWEIFIVDVQDYGNYQVTVNTVFDEANAWLP